MSPVCWAFVRFPAGPPTAPPSLGSSDCLRLEYRRTPMGVTAVCPGFVSAGLFENGQGGDPSQPVRKPAAIVFTAADVVARKAVRGM